MCISLIGCGWLLWLYLFWMNLIGICSCRLTCATSSKSSWRFWRALALCRDLPTPVCLLRKASPWFSIQSITCNTQINTIHSVQGQNITIQSWKRVYQVSFCFHKSIQLMWHIESQLFRKTHTSICTHRLILSACSHTLMGIWKESDQSASVFCPTVIQWLFFIIPRDTVLQITFLQWHLQVRLIEMWLRQHNQTLEIQQCWQSKTKLR